MQWVRFSVFLKGRGVGLGLAVDSYVFEHSLGAFYPGCL